MLFISLIKRTKVTQLGEEPEVSCKYTLDIELMDWNGEGLVGLLEGGEQRQDQKKDQDCFQFHRVDLIIINHTNSTLNKVSQVTDQLAIIQNQQPLLKDATFFITKYI